jgi:hypothetical protein
MATSGGAWIQRIPSVVVAEAAPAHDPDPPSAAAPYLNTLNFSERELRDRSGWTLTRAAILEMQQVTRAFAGELVVMFLPFKSQVY